MDVQQIRDTIAALESAKLQRLTGQQVSKSSYPEVGSFEMSATSLEEINMEITRLRLELARLTGEPSGVGPRVARFGCRP